MCQLGSLWEVDTETELGVQKFIGNIACER